jgi:hypothetical protein
MTHAPTANRRPHASPVTTRAIVAGATMVALIALSSPRHAAAQESVDSVLAFLLTPRSIDTGDAAADGQATAAAGGAIAGSLVAGTAMLPAATSAGGFAFRLDNALGGAAVRSSAAFGALFTERALTAGRGSGSLDLSFRRTAFDTFDGRDLRDGTLRVTARRIEGEADPVDVESIALRLDTNVVTLTGTYGVADRVDIAGIVPLIRLTLRGERIDTYRGQTFLLSSAEATTSGIGDIALRVKYNLLRQIGSGVAVTAQLRLPTGREEDLLGSGDTTFQPGVVGSLERGRIALDGNVGYSTGGPSGELVYGAAVTVMGTPRLMLIGEVAGRRLGSAARLVESVAPHPGLTGIETIRLSATDEPGQRVMAVGGVKWNPSGSWLLSASVLRRLTAGGLTADWVPGASIEYVIGQ